MIKNLKIVILVIFLMLFTLPAPVKAETPAKNQIPTQKELKQLDSMIAKRLNLTDEQIKILRANKSKNMKEMQNTIDRMEVLRKKIYNVYIIGIPKYQADFRTAHMKLELALLKQNADRIRHENRKNFESILTSEQKAEFEILKKELIKNKQN